MRVVFMGTPAFAVPSLEALATRSNCVAVYTRPDAASGRGAHLRPSPVKESAIELGLPVYQPTTLRDAEKIAALAGLEPDVICVAAYGLILPREVLEIPRFGCLNVHASLLPRWRGAAPVERAILAGDESTGVSIMRIEEGLDSGPYCIQSRVPLDGLSSAELTAILSEAGAEALLRALDAVASGAVRWIKQDDELVTYASKISKADVAIAPSLSAEEIVRRVRASSRRAPSRALVAGAGVTILAAQAAQAPVPSGAVAFDARTLLLGVADGAVRVERLRPDGKAAMSAADWARGTRLGAAAAWGAER